METDKETSLWGDNIWAETQAVRGSPPKDPRAQEAWDWHIQGLEEDRGVRNPAGEGEAGVSCSRGRTTPALQPPWRVQGRTQSSSPAVVLMPLVE